MAKRQLNMRASRLTADQIETMVGVLGMRQTEIISVAVDRMYRDEISRRVEAFELTYFLVEDPEMYAIYPGAEVHAPAVIEVVSRKLHEHMRREHPRALFRIVRVWARTGPAVRIDMASNNPILHELQHEAAWDIAEELDQLIYHDLAYWFGEAVPDDEDEQPDGEAAP